MSRDILRNSPSERPGGLDSSNAIKLPIRASLLYHIVTRFCRGRILALRAVLNHALFRTADRPAVCPHHDQRPAQHAAVREHAFAVHGRAPSSAAPHDPLHHLVTSICHRFEQRLKALLVAEKLGSDGWIGGNRLLCMMERVHIDRRVGTGSCACWIEIE